MKMMISLAALLAATLAATLAAAGGVSHVAQAQPPADRTILVQYGDLDLASAQDRAAFDRRIRDAVRLACGTASAADLAGSNEAADCRRDLMASLVERRQAALASDREPGSVLAARP